MINMKKLNSLAVSTITGILFQQCPEQTLTLGYMEPIRAFNVGLSFARAIHRACHWNNWYHSLLLLVSFPFHICACWYKYLESGFNIYEKATTIKIPIGRQQFLMRHFHRTASSGWISARSGASFSTMLNVCKVPLPFNFPLSFRSKLLFINLLSTPFGLCTEYRFRSQPLLLIFMTKKYNHDIHILCFLGQIL